MRMETGRLPVLSDFGKTTRVQRKVVICPGKVLENLLCTDRTPFFQLCQQQSPFAGMPCTRLTLMLSQVVDHAARKQFGLDPISPDLPTAEGIFVRSGVAPHFDLWITADSDVGCAIKDGCCCGAKSQTPAGGEVEETIRLLKDELASRDPKGEEASHKLALELQRQDHE